jgi:Fe-S-cluster-containing dehydrogenase component
VKLVSQFRALLVDLDKCVGCYSCEVGCQQWHQLPEYQKRIRIIQIGPEKVNGKLRMYFYPQINTDCDLCQQQSEPFCVSNCPVEALVLCDNKDILKKIYESGRFQICRLLE